MVSTLAFIKQRCDSASIAMSVPPSACPLNVLVHSQELYSTVFHALQFCIRKIGRAHV
jgi:hypothetical protein